MKLNQEPENDARLDQALREWKVEAPLPPRFQERVWQRIARTETQPEPSVWRGLVRLMADVLPRPRIALAYVSTLVILGVAAGSWAAQRTTSRLDANLSQRYVQSIDPSLQDTLHP